MTKNSKIVRKNTAKILENKAIFIIVLFVFLLFSFIYNVL